MNVSQGRQNVKYGRIIQLEWVVKTPKGLKKSTSSFHRRKKRRMRLDSSVEKKIEKVFETVKRREKENSFCHHPYLRTR